MVRIKLFRLYLNNSAVIPALNIKSIVLKFDSLNLINFSILGSFILFFSISLLKQPAERYRQVLFFQNLISVFLLFSW